MGEEKKDVERDTQSYPKVNKVNDVDGTDVNAKPFSQCDTMND